MGILGVYTMALWVTLRNTPGDVYMGFPKIRGGVRVYWRCVYIVAS